LLRPDELGEANRVARAGPLYSQHLISTMAAKSAQADLLGKIHHFSQKKKEESVCMGRNP